MAATEKRGIQSVDFIGNILSALAASSNALPLKDLSSLTKVPAAKLHRYLTSLIRIGLASQQADGKYDLGPLAIRIGLSAIGRRRIIDEAETAARTVIEQHGVSGHLSVWSEHGPVIVRTVQGGVPLITSLGLGRTLPLSRSATGFVFLAHLPSRLTEPLLRQEARDQADLDAALKAAEQARAEGIAVVDGTVIPGLAAISVPIFDFDSNLACALTLTAMTGGFGPKPLASAPAGALRDIARAISLRHLP